MIRKAFKFKLYESKKLKHLYRFSGSCRFIWNKALALNSELLKSGEKIHSYANLCKDLTQWKHDSELLWLKDVPSQALQQVLKDLSRAYSDGFNKNQPLKLMPIFKKRGKSIESFRIPTAPKIEGNRIFVPKIGWFKFHKSQNIMGKPKNFTLSEHCGSWYVSIQVEIDEKMPTHPSKSEVGIDLGISKHATVSDGTIYLLPDISEWEREKKSLQQELSRRKKFGVNWKKTKRKLAKVSSKIARIRHDYLHKTSTEIAKNHSHIVIEDLKVKKMSKSSKGTATNPGSHVKVKSAMNREITAQGWYTLRVMLTYKSEWLGGLLTVVNPKNTSRECFECGHIAPENRTTQASFKCVACGHSENADLNASKVILKRAGHSPMVLAS